MSTISDMKQNFSQHGRVEWICVRPERLQPVTVCDQADLSVESGLIGDHFSGKPGDSRMVTLIQQEHIHLVASLLRKDRIDPGLLRRNIVVSGLNLLALKKACFRIGTAILQGTTPCPPCSRMEENLGFGGYNAMRGHGGINAKVLQDGTINIGDPLVVLSSNGIDTI